MGKQFNLNGINGLYLANETNTTLTTANYKTNLIQDYDFFPDSIVLGNAFDLKNAKYKSGAFIGSNSIAASNSSLTFSQIYKHDGIIANKKYYNSFKLYFKFTSSQLGSYVFPGFTGASASTLTAKVLNALRVKVYIQLGSNFIPASLDGLEKVVSNGALAQYDANWTAVTSADVSGGSGNINQSDGAKTGIQLTTGLNTEDCIDMRWSTSSLFTNLASNGYGFRINVSLPDFDQTALKNRDYRIIIKYYNIGVTTSGVPTLYTTSESVELMSNRYTYYEQISVPIYSSPIGGGGISQDLSFNQNQQGS